MNVYYSLNSMLVSILMLFGNTSFSQSLLINLNNSSIESFPVSSIQSIKFGESTMILNQTDGTVISYSIADIDNYAFDTESSIDNSLLQTHDQLSIFPNPATDIVNIAFKTNKAEYITINIFDISGKLVAEIYKGMYYPDNQNEWRAELSPGKYFCSILNGRKLITKPLIIQ